MLLVMTLGPVLDQAVILWHIGPRTKAQTTMNETIDKTTS
jgi:hypothetical protein